MKLLLPLFCITVLSCKEVPKETKDEMAAPEEVTIAHSAAYPVALQGVFDAHGGLTTWKKKRTLIFEIPKQEGNEVHTTDLYTRRDKIEMQDFSMGFDGQEVWLIDDKEAYKGDPVFYHNLMFYFYAMPFVLADSGIHYGETENLEFEGTSYPGIRISYGSGVGTSPKDEYFIHYDPRTNQMEWLGYTVTYRSGEKSDNIKWIRYDDWMTVEGLTLPKSMTWFEYEGRNMIKPRNTVSFQNVGLSKKVKPVSFYAKPEGARTMDRSE